MTRGALRAGAFLLTALWLLVVVGGGGRSGLASPSPSSPEPLFRVVSASPLPSVTRLFRYDEREAVARDVWSGADGAHSIPLDAHRVLWLFGDTLIGRVRQERRVEPLVMVHNTAALQDLRKDEPHLRFAWRATAKGAPEDILRAPGAASWYWPGDGARVGSVLYLFCMRVRQAPGPPGFDFDWSHNDLLCIANPTDSPSSWRIDEVNLPPNVTGFMPGAAVAVDGEWLYAYGLFSGRGKAADKSVRPLGLARIRLSSLPSGHPRGGEHAGPEGRGGDVREPRPSPEHNGWQYACSDGRGGVRWSEDSAGMVHLFDDAAPEMSVTRAPGGSGWVATYTPRGFDARICMRFASKPEGPWSAALEVYRCPEGALGILTYSARAHPALARQPNEMVLTYCRNTASVEHHMREPRLYAPQGVRVLLESR